MKDYIEDDGYRWTGAMPPGKDAQGCLHDDLYGATITKKLDESGQPQVCIKFNQEPPGGVELIFAGGHVYFSDGPSSPKRSLDQADAHQQNKLFALVEYFFMRTSITQRRDGGASGIELGIALANGRGQNPDSFTGLLNMVVNGSGYGFSEYDRTVPEQKAQMDGVFQRLCQPIPAPTQQRKVHDASRGISPETAYEAALQQHNASSIRLINDTHNPGRKKFMLTLPDGSSTTKTYSELSRGRRWGRYDLATAVAFEIKQAPNPVLPSRPQAAKLKTQALDYGSATTPLEAAKKLHNASKIELRSDGNFEVTTKGGWLSKGKMQIMTPEQLSGIDPVTRQANTWGQKKPRTLAAAVAYDLTPQQRSRKGPGSY